MALLLLCTAGMPVTLFAQDSTHVSTPWYESIDLKGLVVGNVDYNIGEPRSRQSTLRLYDVDNQSFELALVALSVKHDASKGKAGFRVDIDMGPHIPEIDHAVGLEMGKLDLRQAYISYIADIGKGLTIDLGKFTTPCGYELIESPYALSDNATHGFLFNYALPFTHTGVRLTYPIATDLTISAMGINGWDNVVDNNESPSAGGQVTWAPKGTSVSVSGIVGPELSSDDLTRSLIDLAASSLVTENLTLGLGADYGREKRQPTEFELRPAPVIWKGVAGYATAKFSEPFAIALRAEVFDDLDGVRTGTPQTLHEYTVTPIWSVAQGFTVKADIRYDLSSRMVFISKNGPQSHQTTASLFFLYAF